MPNTITFTLPIGDKELLLCLYADGALYWPEYKTLFITDPHFGKADSFHHAGIAIPATILDHDLARLAHLLAHSGATNLIILGDFFHTRHSQSESVLSTLETWRNQHRDLAIVLVQGNHDTHAGPPPAHLAIQSVEAPFRVDPFICHHLPQPQPSAEGYTLAGHLHPYVTLRDRDGSRLRLASFIFGPHQAILPAFGGFTGGSVYTPSVNDLVFVIAQNEIIEIPTARQQAR
jgi:DNA ligase-associated metallophosphoesterase